MLPPSHRMRNSAEFALTVRAGRRTGRRTVVVHVYAPEPHPSGPAGDAGAEPAKIGFVVSKQVGNAVVRNRTRRRLRHVMYGQLSDLDDGSLIVVRALPAAATAGGAQLMQDLRGALAAALRVPQRATSPSGSSALDGSR